jgi:isopenicillin-N epimerase
MTHLKDFFSLDPSIHFLNHGSFGACPKPVFEVYQDWQRQLERQPVEFLGRRSTELLAEARASLANYLGVAADEVVYFTNPTTAINMVARNLVNRPLEKNRGTTNGFSLEDGDEILATDHEYGAMDRAWNYACKLSGARYVRQRIALPVSDQESFVESFWDGVNERTRVIFISHISSTTALIFPVVEICRRARSAGILCIVDGAHAPGQLPLDLKAIGADIYAGACHKWLCAPKGAGFLYVRRELQDWLDPLIVSWGYESENPSDSQFIDYHEWQGTRDLAAFLSVPAAIHFQIDQDWDGVRRQCHEMATRTRQELIKLTGLQAVCPPDWFCQMFTARLPQEVDLERLKQRLYDEFRIEVPLVRWNGEKLVRVSFQAYNDEADSETLLRAMEILLE